MLVINLCRFKFHFSCLSFVSYLSTKFFLISSISLSLSLLTSLNNITFLLLLSFFFTLTNKYVEWDRFIHQDWRYFGRLPIDPPLLSSSFLLPMISFHLSSFPSLLFHAVITTFSIPSSSSSSMKNSCRFLILRIQMELIWLFLTK